MAIYSSLGPARMAADALRERNLLQISFSAVVLLVVLALLWQWRNHRPSWSEFGVGSGVALAYGWTFLRMGNPAERTHLIEYGIVAALIHQALLERSRHARHVPAPAALTVAVTALLGLLDEGIQAALPSRVFDWNDVLFNALAGFMVIVARLALAPVQRPGWRLWFLWLMAGFVGWGWSMDPGSFGAGTDLAFLPSLPPVHVPPYVSVAAGATLVGILQWLILGRYLPDAALWVPASLGAAATGFLVVAGAGLAGPDSGLFAGIGGYGALAGVAQWMVLRRHIPRAGWWIPANAVAWLVAVPAGDLMGPPGWAVYAAVTGSLLVLLLRQTSGDGDEAIRRGVPPIRRAPHAPPSSGTP